jgi:RNA polymerase sigma factor (TIGR02999 family)
VSAENSDLFTAMYADLRKLARSRLRRGRTPPMLDTTALVHESYLRFAESGRAALADRSQFLRYASHVMRSVIIDFVRERMADRRGGKFLQVTLTTQVGSGLSGGESEILRVHEALEQLAQHDTRLVQVVEMRYFGGLTETEIAAALGVTDRTVRRDWERARLLLAEALK